MIVLKLQFQSWMCSLKLRSRSLIAPKLQRRGFTVVLQLVIETTRRHSTIGYLSRVEFERKVGLALPGAHLADSSAGAPWCV